MPLPYDVSLKVRNLKCFGEKESGFDTILPVNLIVGRNNAGKSTLLDLIEYATNPKSLDDLGHRGQTPQVILSAPLTESQLSQVFSQNSSGGPIPGNHWQFGLRWLNCPLTWELHPNHLAFIAIEPPFGRDNVQDYEGRLAQAMGNPFHGLAFKRLSPDRDIAPEMDDGEGRAIRPNGRGATTLLHHFISKSHLPSALVEETLLQELNHIFAPDGTFSRIIVQQHGTGHWELYLHEASKGRVPLSRSGSGIKTVILVLSCLLLVPSIENRPQPSDYLFCFEELENNLHPALLRRLLLYLREFAVKHGCKFFLTTHSSVAIDLFAEDEQAQILHVTHDGTSATVKRATTYVHNCGILDDLDVRASDLLQANSIVWVEGPSDRLYFNRWIELSSDGALREGVHYQCVFYGGRLLAHLSANDPTIIQKDVIQILRVNRNAIIMLDSDKANKSQHLNQTKKRVIEEISDMGGFAWVTAGRGVENYIPNEALRSIYNHAEPIELGRYQDIAEFLDAIMPGEGQRLLRNKPLFAERFCACLTRENMKNALDLTQQVEKACTLIREWNR